MTELRTTGRLDFLNADRSADRLIITAASKSYQSSVLALIGSIKCNWSGHPPILVYDLGMEAAFVERLEGYGIPVRKVEPFCPHWRSDFTWKFWCFSDAPTRDYLWLDAGVSVLRPFDEAFRAIEAIGYFCVTNHWPLAPTMSDPQRTAVGLPVEHLMQISSIASGIHGFRKEGVGATLLATALDLARDKQILRATQPFHRHDQSLLTGLLHKFFPPVLYADWKTYAGQTPSEVVNQKIWVHRQRMNANDVQYFHDALERDAEPHIPLWTPPTPRSGVLWWLRTRIAALRGRRPPSNRAGTVVYNGVKD